MKKILILISVFLCVSIVYSQNPSSEKNINSELIGFKFTDYFQFTVQSGFIQPVNPYLASRSYTSGNIGMDISYRVNTELALYIEMRYNFITAKDTAATNSGYFESTIGARYYLIKPYCCRSSLFFESGFGPYVFVQRPSGLYYESNIDPKGRKPTRRDPKDIYESVRRVSLGGNIGIGAELVISNNLFFTIKSKFNSVFESNGCTSFVTGIGGITMKF